MAANITSILIARIQALLAQNGASPETPDLAGQGGSILSSAANYAQILGTAATPLATAVAVAVAHAIGSNPEIMVAATQAVETAAQVDQLATDAAAAGAVGTATLAATGIGAALVLVLSFVLAVLGSNNEDSAFTAAVEQLLNTILTYDKANYWQGKTSLIQSTWTPLGTDLDALTSEGTNGKDVRNQVANFHSHAAGYVNLFLGSANDFWQRPFDQSELFSAQSVPYLYPIEAAPPEPAKVMYQPNVGWYGKLPQPQFNSSSLQDTEDPQSVLPLFLLGIQSYITIQTLAPIVDPANELTFGDFLTSYKQDLQDYLALLTSKYTLIVNGIVKSDLPSASDLTSFLVYAATTIEYSGANTLDSWTDLAAAWGGSPLQDADTAAEAGRSWNGIYGVVYVYPAYGVYQPGPPVAVPYAAPSYLIDLFNVAGLQSDFPPGFFSGPPNISYLAEWTIPWLQNRLLLGRMARWKAIYLFNGFDQVWSMIHSLNVLSNFSPQAAPAAPLAPVKLSQDGTMATGDWSARELCTVLKLDGKIVAGVQYGGVKVSPFNPELSLFALAQILDNIGSGNFGGPPSYSVSGNGPSRPLGLRDRLTAAAI